MNHLQLGSLASDNKNFFHSVGGFGLFIKDIYDCKFNKDQCRRGIAFSNEADREKDKQERTDLSEKIGIGMVAGTVLLAGGLTYYFIKKK